MDTHRLHHHTMKMPDFGDTLRAWRHHRGLSQEKLAEEARSARQVISKYENGKASPTVNMLKRLAKALGVTRSELLAGPPGYEVTDITARVAEPLDNLDSPPVGLEAQEYFTMVPLFETLPQRQPSSHDLDKLPKTPAPRSEVSEACYVVRVPDDTMYGELHAGDLVLCDGSRTPRFGNIVLARYKGQTMLRRYTQQDRHLMLKAEAHNCPPITIKEREELEIWGVYLGICWRQGL